MLLSSPQRRKLRLREPKSWEGVEQGFDPGSVPISRSLASSLDRKMEVVGLHLAELLDLGIPAVSPEQSRNRDITSWCRFPLSEPHVYSGGEASRPPGAWLPSSGESSNLCVCSQEVRGAA